MIAQCLTACFLLSLAGAVRAGAPVAVEVDLPRTVLAVGEPLVIELRATNISDAPIAAFGISSSLFSLTFYQGDIVEGCEVMIATADPPPPNPPLFFFSWRLDGLQPGESAACRITYPQTLYEGTETISLFTSIAGTFWPDLAEFTYSLQGEPPPVPQPVPARSLIGLPLLILLLLLVGRWRVRSRRA